MIDVQAMTGSDDEELVFDDADAFAPAPPDPAPATSRKRIARAAARPASEAPRQAAPAPAAAPPAAATRADPPPSAVAVTAAVLPAWIALAALAIGLLAAMLAAVGLLMATRTIAHADGAARAAERERARLARVPAALARLDDVITREQAALARLQDGRAGQPATIGDIHRELDGLRLALDRHQPQQDLKTTALIQSGQAEITGRLETISETLDRVDRASRAAK